VEKAQSNFLEVLTRPSLLQTRMVYCQPFLSAQEQKEGILGEPPRGAVLPIKISLEEEACSIK